MANLFCARCNDTKAATPSVDANGEYTLTCDTCGHTVKFPAGSDLATLVRTHNEHNVPRVLVADDGSPILTDEQEAAIAALDG